MNRAVYRHIFSAMLVAALAGCPDDAQVVQHADASAEGPDAALTGEVADLDAALSADGDAQAGADAGATPEDAATDSALDATSAVRHDGSVADAAHDAASDSASDDASAPAMCGRVLCDCTLNGIPLFGKVKVVGNFPTFKVKKDSSFPDLKVHETSVPSRCGEWEYVDNFEDFSVEWDDNFPDFEIQASSFPGLGYPP